MEHSLTAFSFWAAITRAFSQRYLMTRISAGSVMSLGYTHDGAGNVKTTTGLARPPLVPGTTDYAHTANRLVSSSGFSAKSYSYDNVGNIESDGVRTFEYDQSNRLVRVTEGGVVLGEYAYDAFNRRVKKVADGKTTYFHYDADSLLICETDASGNAVRDYIYLNGEPVAVRVTGGWYWFLNDHLGTPQKMVDASGTVVWGAAYLPFGKARVLTTGIENNLRFPGQYFDEETGLHYNWNRYYDPVIGRYVIADPIGLDGGINLYAYVSNDPINLFDFFGLEGTIRGPGSLSKRIMDSVYTRAHKFAHPEQWGPGQGVDNFMFMVDVATFGLGIGAEKAGMKCLSKMNSKIGSFADEIFSAKAPKQVTPGIRALEGQHVDDLGRVQPWRAHYDKYGRLEARTDFNAGNKAAGIPKTHHHTYEWGPGKTPLETGSHIPGEYKP